MAWPGTGGLFETPLSNVTILGSKTSLGSSQGIMLADETDPSSFRSPGTYIFFLGRDGNSQYFYPENGLQGTFKITGQSVARSCDNYFGPSPLAAATLTGSITTRAAMVALIPRVLPPNLVEQSIEAAASAATH